MNLDITMWAQIKKVERELEQQRRLTAEAAFMDQTQKEKADRLREQRYQKKYLRDKKRLEQSGYRERLDTLVQRLNHYDLRFNVLKHRLLIILSENPHNEGINFDNITFSVSTAEEIPNCIVLYCTWNSTRRELIIVSYDDNNQATVWMNLFQHTNKIHLSSVQSYAAEEIINFLMTT